MNNKTLILASNNEHKLIEVRAILGPGYKIVKQSDYNIKPIPETGLNFEENAIIKATGVFEATGITTIADDSGLVVDALNGAPGVFSARYSGENANDSSNNVKLLKNMAHLHKKERAARFECVIALVDKKQNNLVQTFKGAWNGTILYNPKGSNGFGYDPLFFDPVIGRSSAELSDEEKNKVSHRAIALAALKEHIKNKKTKERPL
jgi:XTP/dITP diphosphohydrolase